MERSPDPVRDEEGGARTGTIGVAVVGAGYWGPNLIRSFEGSGRSTLRWVVDTDTARLKRVEELYPGVGISTGVEAALSDPLTRALVIATPATTHFELAHRAMDGGKDLFIEKPLTTSSRQSALLVERAEACGIVLMVGHVFLYNEAVRAVKEHIEGLGRIYYVSMTRTNPGPIRSDVNVAWDLLPQDLSIAQYWLEADPLSVTAHGGAWLTSGREDALFATATYPGQTLVHLHCSWLHPTKTRKITIVGSRGMLEFDDISPDQPIRIFKSPQELGRGEEWFPTSFLGFQSVARSSVLTAPPLPRTEPLRLECEHFLDCVETRARPFSSGHLSVRIARVIEAINESARTNGEEVTVLGGGSTPGADE